MKAFNEGSELRLQKGDLTAMLEDAINMRLSATMKEHVVKAISLHPTNKYVIRIEFAPKQDA